MKTNKNYTNTFSQGEINAAIGLLEGTGLSVLDCARLIKNALDFKPKNLKLNNIQYCSKVVDSGIKHLHIKDMSIERGFEEYLKTKTELRPASFEDIKYLGKRLLRNAKYAKMNFSELSITECQKWLNETYPTPSQFNKAHTMLHTFFQYALRQEWADRNVVKLVPKRKVIECEIKALSLPETKALIKASQLAKFADCQAGVALMIWAGIRPQELQRLRWQEIDLEEDIIRIAPTTSKTGGARHIEICKPLKAILVNKISNYKTSNINCKILPNNWQTKWKALRRQAGFAEWTQDVLRHTYASYHAKYFQDLPRLQLNMGHHNLHLLRTRYINFHNISKLDAKNYFLFTQKKT